MIVMLPSAATALTACGQSEQDEATSTVCDARPEVGKSPSVAAAETQITSALTRLAASYQQTPGRIDCG